MGSVTDPATIDPAGSDPAPGGSAAVGPPAIVAAATRTAAVRAGTTTVAAEVAAALDRVAAHGGPATPDGATADPVWIALLDDAGREAAMARAARIDPRLPLAGLTFAVKDNVDLAGLPTTAGCPSYAFRPERSAGVVSALEAAGATAIGKTNLDQFATGLVGTRSPYGAPRSVLSPTRISGGSSSGSAVAVARGDVDVAVGTDTAGSGRVPAAFNGIVGWKPTHGRLGTAGVVPACRSLDCVSLFTRDVDTVATVLDALDRHPPPADVSVRPRPVGAGAWTAGWAARRPRIGVAPGALEAVGDDAYRDAWARAVDGAGELGDLVEIDLEPFLEAGRLLYDGPWVAERYAAVGAFVDGDHAGIDPVVAGIVRGGRDATAVDAFRARYRMDELRAHAAGRFADLDAILVPSAPLHPTVEQVAADPVGVNSLLGTFTNMVNLLDLCALAIPGPPTADGRPFGVTLWAPAWRDELLIGLGARWERSMANGAGVVGSGEQRAPGTAVGAATSPVVVAGAHMAGLPANVQLTERGAVLRRTTSTDAGYRLRSLSTDQGPRPGLVRDDGPGASPVEVEVWDLPVDGLGSLLGLLPRGLAIGPVRLRDGSVLPGFVAAADDRARLGDAPSLRGWRDHLLSGG